MSKRYYVTTQFVVEAEDPQKAELLVARRVQEFLNNSKVNAQIVVEATTDTDEPILVDSPPMLTEQTGYVEVPGGKPIPGDGRG